MQNVQLGIAEVKLKSLRDKIDMQPYLSKVGAKDAPGKILG